MHERLPADYYDYIVIDESHHAAAQSYEKALTHFRPKVLLGLTATPERMDGQDIYRYFDRRVAAEIRLPEPINRKLLCPFQYFGVSDTVDLDDLRWVRGGYDRAELSNLYTLSQGVAEKRADHILRSMDRYVTDMNDVRSKATLPLAKLSAPKARMAQAESKIRTSPPGVLRLHRACAVHGRLLQPLRRARAGVDR